MDLPRGSLYAIQRRVAFLLQSVYLSLELSYLTGTTDRTIRSERLGLTKKYIFIYRTTKTTFMKRVLKKLF